MKSYEYDAVVIDSEVYCLDCIPRGYFIFDERLHPIFADSEWDYIPVCCVCGCEHDYVNVLED